MKDKDAQLMMEALRRVNEDEGQPSGLTVKQSGDFIALRREVDEYLTTTGPEDLKAYVLAIIDRYLGTGDQWTDADFMKWRDDPRWGKAGAPGSPPTEPIKRQHGKDNQNL
jgi:hypothetical protein